MGSGARLGAVDLPTKTGTLKVSMAVSWAGTTVDAGASSASRWASLIAATVSCVSEGTNRGLVERAANISCSSGSIFSPRLAACANDAFAPASKPSVAAG